MSSVVRLALPFSLLLPAVAAAAAASTRTLSLLLCIGESGGAAVLDHLSSMIPWSYSGKWEARERERKRERRHTLDLFLSSAVVHRPNSIP